MTAAARLTALQLRRLARRRWPWVALAAGAGVIALAVALALGESGGDRLEELRQGATTLLLLGGLAVALGLGAGSLNVDSDTGHFGMLVGAGAGRGSLVASALLARLVGLAVVLALWGATLQGGALVIGAGLDGELAVHTAVVATGLALTLAAAAAASSVVGRAAAIVFGAAVYLTAQALMNLKAAVDRDFIGTGDEAINAVHAIGPRIPTSPMLADLQERGAAGPAIPRVDINGNEVALPASGWPTIAWTLVWVVALGLVAYAGMRRRPLA